MLMAIFIHSACFPADGAAELREDFTGHGQFQSFTDSGEVFDRAKGGSQIDSSNITYGRRLSTSLSNTTLFSGFILEGPGGYSVSSGLHSMMLNDLQRLNVTAEITTSEEEAYSKYSANGSGKLHERFLIEGEKSRPQELGSIYHTGLFEINSSLHWRV